MQSGRGPKAPKRGSRRGAAVPAPERAILDLDAGPLTYTVIRSARRKRTIQLSVDGDGVTVRAPLATSRPFIEALLLRRATWIAHRLATLPVPLQFVTGEALPFLGRNVPLTVTHAEVRAALLRYGSRTFDVRVPATLTGQEHAAAARAALVRWFRRKTMALLRRSLARWAPVVGASPIAWAVREQKRRWGSCSASGVLRFNWRLSMLHPHLVDYVVVHELCHLKHPNHSPEFWRSVEDAMPVAPRLRAELRGTALPV
ncbi:MAG: M48 family metallopeptidase [Dehalococcoidia bacterium]